MSFYNLIRLQNNGDNRGAYQIVRNYTASHQNAFFDIIDRSMNGPNAARDAEMRSLLDQWLQRPQRDPYVDNSKVVAVCGTEACEPVPVPIRPTTDFLWQRDPFQLAGGGSGTIEGAGIDYILPYWMGRYYGVIRARCIRRRAERRLWRRIRWPRFTERTLRLASPKPDASRCRCTLDGATLTVTDAGRHRAHGVITICVATQINFVCPDGTATGDGAICGYQRFGNANVQWYSGGRRSHIVQHGRKWERRGCRERGNDAGERSPVAIASAGVTSAAASTCVAVPINLGVDTPTYLTLYGTGSGAAARCQMSSSPSELGLPCRLCMLVQRQILRGWTR